MLFCCLVVCYFLYCIMIFACWILFEWQLHRCDKHLYIVRMTAALLQQPFVHCLKVCCKLQEQIVHWSKVCCIAATSICTLSESLPQAAGTNCTLLECLLHCCDRKKQRYKVVAALRQKKTTQILPIFINIFSIIRNILSLLFHFTFFFHFRRRSLSRTELFLFTYLLY